jgi:hypothetical protein
MPASVNEAAHFARRVTIALKGGFRQINIMLILSIPSPFLRSAIHEAPEVAFPQLHLVAINNLSGFFRKWLLLSLVITLSKSIREPYQAPLRDSGEGIDQVSVIKWFISKICKPL